MFSFAVAVNQTVNLPVVLLRSFSLSPFAFFSLHHGLLALIEDDAHAIVLYLANIEARSEIESSP
jgi:hypothetical protein